MSTHSRYFGFVNRVIQLTKNLKAKKEVRESLQLMILLDAPCKAFQVAKTASLIRAHLKADESDKELCEQLLAKIARLELAQSRKRKASTGATTSEESSSSSSTPPTISAPLSPNNTEPTQKKTKIVEENTTSKKTAPVMRQGAPSSRSTLPAPSKVLKEKNEKSTISTDEKLQKFIEKQKAKMEQKKASTTRTIGLTTNQSIRQAMHGGRRHF